MNHSDAAAIREELNDLGCVLAPDDDRVRAAFRLARVRQPGYLNQEPLYEVVLEADVSDDGQVYLPREFLEAVAGWECYVRVDGDTVHLRDWTTEGGDVLAVDEGDDEPAADGEEASHDS